MCHQYHRLGSPICKIADRSCTVLGWRCYEFAIFLHRTASKGSKTPVRMKRPSELEVNFLIWFFQKLPLKNRTVHLCLDALRMQPECHPRLDGLAKRCVARLRDLHDVCNCFPSGLQAYKHTLPGPRGGEREHRSWPTLRKRIRTISRKGVNCAGGLGPQVENPINVM